MLQAARLGALRHGGHGTFGCEEFGCLWRRGRSCTVGVGNGDPMTSGWQRCHWNAGQVFLQVLCCFSFTHSFIHSLNRK